MRHMEGESHEAGLKKQRSLFWFGEPKLVIAAIQFMQFGYALALAIVLMYWEIFTALLPFWYLGAVLVCYSVFVYVLSLVLPQYTLCTSLGRMVNQKNLQETVALHRLEDEQRRLRRKKAEARYNNDDSMLALEDAREAESKRDNDDSEVFNPSDISPTEGSSDDGTHDSGDSAIHREGSRRDSGRELKERTALLAALIKSDTASLRSQLPEESREKLFTRTESVRRGRRKTLSDGVASMRAMGNLPALREQRSDATAESLTMDDADALKRDRDSRMALRRANRKKTASASAVIQSWRNDTDTGEKDNKSKDDAAAPKRDREQRMGMRRANRKKASTASAVIQSWRHLDNIEEVTPKGDEKASLNRRGRRKSDSTSDVEQTFFEETKIPEGEELVAPNRRELGKKASSTSDINKTFSEETKAAEGETAALFPNEMRRADASAARIAQRRQSRKKSLSDTSVIQSWHNYSVNDNPREVPTTAPRSMDGIKAFSKSSPIVTASVLEDPGAEQLVVKNPQPIESAPAEHIPSDDLETKSQGSGSIIVDMPGTIIASGDANDMPLKESDGNVLVPEKDDDDTVDAGKSVGELSDDLSDVDIDEELHDSIRPSVGHDENDWKHELIQHFTPAGVIKHMKGFFLSEAYQTVSHVFGTLVVFFLIGQRVEAMNASSGAYAPSDNTWELELKASYWWEAVWYGLFIGIDLLVMILFLPARVRSVAFSGPERKLLVATAFDLMLSVGCLAVLLVAELQRCCDVDVDEERYLADETGFGSDFEDVPHNGTDSEDCCGAWGSRTYGGLGNIEPFTSLIALRVLRFFLAGLLVNPMISKQKKNPEEGSTEGTEGGSGDHSQEHPDTHGHGMRQDVGSALELWERAIGKYPDIVKQYGQFSSELFKSMLGLEILHEPKRSSVLQTNQANGANLLTQESLKIEPQHEPKQSTIKLQAKQYANLPAEVQGLIIAGRLGMPVKCKSESMGHGSNHASELPTLTEDSEVHQHREADPHEFEVDQDQLAEEEDIDSMFIAPNARLVRSMRRCHRRLLPILKEWVTVDVAVTPFEIVYFEVTEGESEDEPAGLQHLRETGRLALKATKGGKGLRLRDIAAGRKVVGHFDLADVIEVHVERDLPLAETHSNEENDLQEEATELETELQAEFWNDDSKIKHDKCVSRNHRWAKTKEDRLKVKSVHGTLVLRFFSDLDAMEGHKDDPSPEVEGGAGLKKLVAYQWAQTIVHSCGRDQLKQLLPHYGDEAVEELQDYIEIAHYHDEEAHKAHKKGHRRRNSHVGLPDVASPPQPTHRRSASALFRRSVSFEGNEKKPSNTKSFRRAISSGDYDDQSSQAGLVKIDLGDAEGKKVSFENTIDHGAKGAQDGNAIV
jgi:hypothetical protein